MSTVRPTRVDDAVSGLPSDPAAPLIADVVFARALPEPLSYLIPDSPATDIRSGVRVRAPLRQQTAVGLVVHCRRERATRELRTIIEPVDAAPVVPENVLELAGWVAEYYFCSLGEAIQPALPPVKCGVGRTVARLTDVDWNERTQRPTKLTPKQRRILAALSTNRLTPVDVLKRSVGGRLSRQELSRLIDAGWIEAWIAPAVVPIPRTATVERPSDRDIIGIADDDRDVIERAFDGDDTSSWARLSARLGRDSAARRRLGELIRDEQLVWHPRPPLESPRAVRAEPVPEQFTPDQTAALERLDRLRRADGYRGALLWGSTGSGKTAVLVELARRVIADGRRVLYLVPEIALAEATIGRLEASLGLRVAIWHSARAESQRYWTHRKIRSGQYPVVVGARSAVYAPLDDIGLVIVDEEHAESYKQSDPAPRYHGRDVAQVRAQREGALCVLSTATPAVETYNNARTGRIELVRMTERPEGRSRPVVQIVDLAFDRRFPRVRRVRNSLLGDAAPEHAAVTDEVLEQIAAAEQTARDGRDPTHAAARLFLTPQLRAQLEATIAAERQAILLLNRRGHSTMIVCTGCGHTACCPDCDVTLTFHLGDRSMRCHLCSHREAAPDNCPNCGQEGFHFRGVGTQKLVAVLKEAYPELAVDRLDTDRTRSGAESAQVLDAFARSETQVLVGTQMVAKGLDFPNVGLVGVVWADRQMAFPDFRAEERTFQLLTQVAGRSGRGDAGGQVVVQSFCPEHELIEWIAIGDEEEFYRRELERRERLHYPPYKRLVRILVDGNDEGRVVDTIRALAVAWRAHLDEGDWLLGPAASPIRRQARQFRYHMLLKTANLKRARGRLRGLIDDVTGKRGNHGVRVVVDVDAIDFM